MEPDVNKPNPISIISLASDLVSIDDPKPDSMARNRPKISSGSSKPVGGVTVLESISIDGLVKAC